MKQPGRVLFDGPDVGSRPINLEHTVQAENPRSRISFLPVAYVMNPNGPMMLGVADDGHLHSEYKPSAPLEEAVTDNYESRGIFRRLKPGAAVASVGGLAALAACGSPTAPSHNGDGTTYDGPTIRAVNVLDGTLLAVNSVTIDGAAAEGVVNPDGTYTLKNSISGEHIVDAKGPDILQKNGQGRRYRQIFSGNKVYVVKALRNDFPIDIYDTIARSNSFSMGEKPGIPDGTIKWGSKPTVYIDKEDLTAVLWKGRIKYENARPFIMNFLNNVLPSCSGGLFDSSFIEVEKSSQMPADGTPGTYIIRGLFDPSNSVGASDREWVNRENIAYAAVLELTQNFGDGSLNADGCTAANPFLSEVRGKNSGTIYVEFREVVNPTPLDLMMARFQNSPDVPPGTRSPYDTSHIPSATQIVVNSLAEKVFGFISPAKRMKNPELQKASQYERRLEARNIARHYKHAA